MVDIPEVKLEYNSTPSIQAPTSLNVPQQDNLIAEQVSKSLGQASDYFHKQMETASNDEASRAYNALRDEFNTGFNVGYGEGDLGLKNIEGYDSFKTARSNLSERLNKRRDELINGKNYNKYTREVIQRKLDDAYSTFNYYMDNQEGQVKALDATRNHQIERQSKAEDLSALFTLYNGSPQANQLLQNKIDEAELSSKEFYYGRGLATRERVADEAGNERWVYKLSPPAQFEMQKNISEDVSSAVLNLAATNPKAAKAALQQFGKYVLPNVQTRLNKAIGEKDKQDTAYGRAYNAVVLNNANPEIIKKIEDEYVNKDDTEGLKEFRTQVSRIRTEQVKSEKDISADLLAAVRKRYFAMPAEEAAKFTDLRSALGDAEMLKAYSGMTKSDQDSMARMFNNTPILSMKALSDVQQALAGGNTTPEQYTELVNQLPVKYRKQMYDAYLGFNISNYNGNVGKDSMANWNAIVALAKKDDTIFDTSDADSTMEAYTAWLNKLDSSKQVFKRGTTEANNQVQEFIAEQRQKNQGWWGSLFNSNNNTGQPKFGVTEPIGGKKQDPLTETEINKIKVLQQQGMTQGDALLKVLRERSK